MTTLCSGSVTAAVRQVSTKYQLAVLPHALSLQSLVDSHPSSSSLPSPSPPSPPTSPPSEATAAPPPSLGPADNLPHPPKPSIETATTEARAPPPHSASSPQQPSASESKPPQHQHRRAEDTGEEARRSRGRRVAGRLVPLLFWYDKPHVASTRYYRETVPRNIPSKPFSCSS